MFKQFLILACLLHIAQIDCRRIISPQAHPILDTIEKKVLILGVCKNVAKCIPNMRNKIEQLGKQFKDYRVFIYENNSTDNTVQLLRNWCQINPKVTVTCESLSHEELLQRVKIRSGQAPSRMELIAYARNVVLNQALDPQFDDYEFVIMIDLDFMRGWQVADVIASFSLDQEWDCLAANGIHPNNFIHYDRYAYRSDIFPLGPELIGEFFWSHLFRPPLILMPSFDLHPVYSAFGGLAIYKRKALKGCSYSGYATDDIKKLYELILNKESCKSTAQYAAYRSTIKEQNGYLPVIFQPNSGYDGPVCCEHLALHATMILNGYDKIFINPRMICQY